MTTCGITVNDKTFYRISSSSIDECFENIEAVIIDCISAFLFHALHHWADFGTDVMHDCLCSCSRGCSRYPCESSQKVCPPSEEEDAQAERAALPAQAKATPKKAAPARAAAAVAGRR